jgi:hypothetical protein
LPVVRYTVSRLVLENQDALLKASGLNDIGEWDYQRVREYLVGDGGRKAGFIDVYRDWQDLGEINDPRTGKRLSLDFKATGKVPVGRPPKGGRAQNLNQKTVDWLALSIEFNRQAVRALNMAEGLLKLVGPPDTVSALVTSILNEEAKAVVKRADKAGIGREAA